jgi:hypothetical protein
MRLSDLNLHNIGNTIQITGCIYSGNGNHYFCWFPGEESPDGFAESSLFMDLPEWETFLKQTDTLETEIMARAKDKTITKAIVRKAERQIATHIQWAVFRRDHYTCRYCGDNACPLTVDHIVLWEEGGPSIEKNLVAACKKCNRTRGNTQYGDWLRSNEFKTRSRKLTQDDHLGLLAIERTIPSIPRNIQMRSR